MAQIFKPHPYQREAIDAIINNPVKGLFLGMGLGKTAITLTAIQYIKYEEMAISKVLVVAPKKVVELTWSDEVDKWEHLKQLRVVKVVGTPKQRVEALKRKADVYLISRDSIAWLVSLYGGVSLPFDMVVIDELSSFKSSKSQRFKALKHVRPSIERMVGLTGTPAPNGLQDLWAQVYLLDRGERLYKKETSYRDEFFYQHNYSYKIKNKKCAEEIHRRIKDLCLSMSAKDYLTLPEFLHNDVPVALSKETLLKYEEFEREKILEILDGLEDGAVIAVTHTAALANKLMQFANGAVYDEDKVAHVVHDEKLDRLEEIIDTANGAPVLVAYAFQHDRDRIMERLKAYKPRLLSTEKDKNDWNAGKIPVLVMHPASGGHGLNLQDGGSIIVWFGLTYSLELYQQFNARLDRQGQKQAGVIHRLISRGTIDERIAYALAEKEDNQDALLDALKARMLEVYNKNAKGVKKSFHF